MFCHYDCDLTAFFIRQNLKEHSLCAILLIAPMEKAFRIRHGLILFRRVQFLSGTFLFLGVPSGARTHDPQIKSLMLYQLSYKHTYVWPNTVCDIICNKKRLFGKRHGECVAAYPSSVRHILCVMFVDNITDWLLFNQKIKNRRDNACIVSDLYRASFTLHVQCKRECSTWNIFL